MSQVSVGQPLMTLAPELVKARDLQGSALWLCGIVSCVYIGTEKSSYVGSEPQVQLEKGCMGESVVHLTLKIKGSLRTPQRLFPQHRLAARAWCITVRHVWPGPKKETLKMREFLEVLKFTIKRRGMFFLDVDRLSSDIFRKIDFPSIDLYPKTALEASLPGHRVRLCRPVARPDSAEEAPVHWG